MFIFLTFPNVISYEERKHIKQQEILKQLLQEAAAVPYLHTAIDTISTFTNNISVLTSNENSFKRDTSNVKTSQCEILHKGPTSAFVFFVSKGKDPQKADGKAFQDNRKLSNTQSAHTIHFHLYSIPLTFLSVAC